MSDYVSFIHKSTPIINKKFVILLLLSKKNPPTTKGFVNAVYGRLVPREIAKVFDNAD